MTEYVLPHFSNSKKGDENMTNWQLGIFDEPRVWGNMARQSSVSLYANYDQLSKHICHSYDFPCLKFKKFYYQEIFAPH